jgi:hypothetical protein
LQSLTQENQALMLVRSDIGTDGRQRDERHLDQKTAVLQGDCLVDVARDLFCADSIGAGAEYGGC